MLYRAAQVVSTKLCLFMKLVKDDLTLLLLNLIFCSHETFLDLLYIVVLFFVFAILGRRAITHRIPFLYLHLPYSMLYGLLLLFLYDCFVLHFIAVVELLPSASLFKSRHGLHGADELNAISDTSVQPGPDQERTNSSLDANYLRQEGLLFKVGELLESVVIEDP